MLQSACAQPSGARPNWKHTFLVIVSLLSPPNMSSQFNNNPYQSMKFKHQSWIATWWWGFGIPSVPENSCQRVITHTAELRVLKKFKKQNKRCRKRQGSFRSKLWDGKRLPRQTQPRKLRGPNIHNKKNKHKTLSIYITNPTARSRRPYAFHLELPSLLTPQPRVRYLALNNADSAVNTLKVAELLSDFLVKKSAGRTDARRMKTSFIRAVKLMHDSRKRKSQLKQMRKQSLVICWKETIAKTCRSVAHKLYKRDKNQNKSTSIMHLKAVKYK